MRKNFRSDISIRESFYNYDQSGERIQSLVPENVRIEYFTPAYPRVRLVCSRNGDTFHNCSLSENGRVLVCNLALSRKSLGVGPLLKIVKHSVADSSFPYDFQNKEHIASTGIDLWGGPSDAGELESESVLSEVILRYGYSAYRLAVLDGFEGTEQEWLESLIGDEGKSAYQVAVDNGFEGTVAEWLASLVGAPGKSAYQVAVDNGFEGTEQEWLESLIGDEGKSAYQVAVDNGFEGTVAEWLASLVGPVGPPPNITIGTVETGNPGTDAEVHIAGTAAAPVLSFKIPRGQPGVAEVCYKHVASLPTASADTMSALYLVDTATTNVYDVYYTSYDGSAYSWVQLGTTTVNLSDYATTEELSQLEAEVHNLSGKYYGIYEDAESLPEGDAVGYAFVGTEAPFAIYQFDGEDWTDSGATIDSIQGEPGVGFESVSSPTPADGTAEITLSNGDTITLNLNHNHPQYLKYVMLESESDMPASPDSTTLYMWPEV